MIQNPETFEPLLKRGITNIKAKTSICYWDQTSGFICKYANNLNKTQVRTKLRQFSFKGDLYLMLNPNNNKYYQPVRYVSLNIGKPIGVQCVAFMTADKFIQHINRYGYSVCPITNTMSIHGNFEMYTHAGAIYFRGIEI